VHKVSKWHSAVVDKLSCWCHDPARCMSLKSRYGLLSWISMVKYSWPFATELVCVGLCHNWALDIVWAFCPDNVKALRDVRVMNSRWIWMWFYVAWMLWNMWCGYLVFTCVPSNVTGATAASNIADDELHLSCFLFFHLWFLDPPYRAHDILVYCWSKLWGLKKTTF